MKHGEKLVFGENNEFGLVQQGFGLKVVEIGKDGYTWMMSSFMMPIVRTIPYN